MSSSSAARGGYAVRVHKTFDDLPRETWGALARRSLEGSIFQDAAWVRAWWETSRPAGADLHLAAAYAGDAVVALAPLYRGSTGRGDAALRFLGGFHNDYHFVLADRDHPASLGTLVRHLVFASDGVRRIDFNEVQAGSALHEALAAGDIPAVATDSTPCPIVDLVDHPDLESLWNKESVRRKLRRIERAGALAVEHIEDRTLIADRLDRLFELHRARWRGTSSPSAFEDPRVEAFYRRFVETVDDGRVVFTTASLDGTTVACHLGLVSGRDFLWYKAAYDPSVADLSPGLVMLADIIRMAHGAGFERLDFTRGDEAFKARFANRTRTNVNLTVHRRRAGYTAARAYRWAQLTYRRLRHGMARPDQPGPSER